MKDKKIALYNSTLRRRDSLNVNKLTEGCSDLERIIYLEAIELLNINVNPDKVSNWVNNVITQFNDKPKPISEKERLKREQQMIKKKCDKELREELKNSLSNDMKLLLDSNGVIVIGFFDYKCSHFSDSHEVSITDNEYKLFKSFSDKKGYIFTDFGDGAYEPFVTTKIIDSSFFNRYNELRCGLEDLDVDVTHEVRVSKETILDSYVSELRELSTVNSSDFINRIESVI